MTAPSLGAWLTTREIAERMGVHVSTARRVLHRLRVPVRRVGARGGFHGRGRGAMLVPVVAVASLGPVE